MYLCVTYATFQKGCETAYQIIQIIKIPHVPMFLIQANMKEGITNLYLIATHKNLRLPPFFFITTAQEDKMYLNLITVY